MTGEPGARLHPTGRLIPAGLDDALVAAVVERFYERARPDEIIGPVFDRVIAAEAWPAHLETITDFWSSMLLGTQRYHGRPMPKHLVLDELSDRHFVRWLALFKLTVEELCPPQVANLFIDRAERVAQSFRLGLAQHRGLDSTRIAPLRAGPLSS